MLIIGRKQDESIMIGNDIEVVVLDVIGETVCLGIVASSEISVLKKEKYAELKAMEYKNNEYL